MRTCSLLIAFFLGLICKTSFADPVVPENFPSCTVITLSAGIQACAFIDLEDWKLVLKADRELTFQRMMAKKMDERADNLSLQVATLEGQVAALENVQVLLADRNEELTRELIESDRLLQEERSKPQWGSTAAWTAFGVSTSVLLGFVLAGVL